MADDNLDEHDERLKDRLLNSEFALLNILATIASLFISVASLLAALSPRIPRCYFIAIILLCSGVLLCVLFDFRFYRLAYQNMAFTPKDIRHDPATADAYRERLSRQKYQTRSRRRWKRRREQLCYGCLFATIILFIIIVARY